MNTELVQSLVKGCKPVSKDDYPHDLFMLHKNRKKGRFKIRKTTIPKFTEQQYYDQKEGMCRCVFLDDYDTVQLREEKESIWMSDTPMEYETNKKAIDLARGDVLECGLGIGLFSYYASKKKEVKSVTIIEKESDVIKLVYPVIKNEKTKVMEWDAKFFLEHTKFKYDMIHVDIWGDILPYKEFKPIIKLAKKKLKPNGKIVCWLDQLWFIIQKNIKNGARVSNGLGYFPPCIACGKVLRNDFGGFCMDCADGLGVSELFIKVKKNRR